MARAEADNFIHFSQDEAVSRTGFVVEDLAHSILFHAVVHVANFEVIFKVFLLHFFSPLFNISKLTDYGSRIGSSFKDSAESALSVAGASFAGGLIAGPPGLAVGGALGGLAQYARHR